MLNVIVETQPDRLRTLAALRLLRGAGDLQIKVQAAGGYSAALSLARSRLADGRGPVILLLAATRDDSERHRERATNALAEIALSSDFRVVVIVPSPHQAGEEAIASSLRSAVDHWTAVA